MHSRPKNTAEDRRDETTSAHQKQTDWPNPKSNHKLLNADSLYTLLEMEINTATAGTKLVLQWILINGFRWYFFQLQDSISPVVM